jgi:LPXTG-motif cell wall-anchored protein
MNNRTMMNTRTIRSLGSPATVVPLPLVEGTGFNCTSDMCYGIGSHDAEFRQYQQLLNQILASAGYSTVAVDGKIGTDTVDGTRKAAAFALTIPKFSGYAVFNDVLNASGDQKRSVSMSLLILTSYFNEVAEYLQSVGKLVTSPPPPPSSGGGGAPLPTVTPLPGQTSADMVQQVIAICKATPKDPRCAQACAICKAGGPDMNTDLAKQACKQLGGSNTVWWIVGGLALASIVGTTGYVIYRRRRRR